MKNIQTFSLVLAMLICNLSFSITKNSNSITYNLSQEKTITGMVISDGTGLPGASIVIVGTKQGTTTDENGKYSLKCKVGDVLECSFIGMTSQRATVGSQNFINFTMAGNSQLIECVVVTGMGIERNENDYETFKRKDITQAANPNAIQALSGKVSGLQINTTTNGVNSDTRIVLRGNRSINAPIGNVMDSNYPKEIANIQDKFSNNKPLFIVDNQTVQEETFKLINPEDIVNVNVIKDQDAIKLYGEKGKNGVIQISSNGKIKWDKINSTLDPNSEDYEAFIENPFESPNTAPLSTFSIDVDNASYTNIRRFINNGQKVPKDAVRVEEMINFFKYQYPQPIGETPFSINTEYGSCPWNEKHQLVKIGLQGKDIPTVSLPNSNFVFLIDVSGSMSDQNKLPLVKESLKILTHQLREEDKISIVVYAGAAGLVLPPTSGKEKEKIINSLETLSAGGSTAGGEGIKLAYKVAEENFIKNGNNRVIIATDGDFNVGMSSNQDMETLIEEKRKSGVFLTCLGYGMGNYKDSKLETLADKGNGNYAYIDNIQEANRFLVKEFKGSMFAIAKDVKIQIEFNPKHVQSYRLIGYENRKLKAEDFTNDAIDAGELGSGHTVTALYEIIPTGVTSKFYETPIDLKYKAFEPKTEKYTNELATIKFRYKKPDGTKSIEIIQTIENIKLPIDNCSEDFKFSTAVAWFGLKIRDSKLLDNKNTDAIVRLANEGKAFDKDGYRAEFIRLVEALK
ncbi:Probable outer membrane protein precursor YfbK [Flavobacterium indicum GPTSA100-9 = DSM 17447]|uniref:Probable outer membrane protein YfbK n=1 Tax=Flavobacterium indicum (strain DSM 17447 / CIP 109464 / GPTSA100-9) TaxID=1094466 RepID=H8XU63_FLAIG|nr:VWA domain-containing protein [Flavobacterium indicum]CCG52846.1 Probable outer membrane protein precursor YfbK [Flavobacterium indicum GPTSA100-9 = DSM 17447]